LSSSGHLHLENDDFGVLYVADAEYALSCAVDERDRCRKSRAPDEPTFWVHEVHGTLVLRRIENHVGHKARIDPEHIGGVGKVLPTQPDAAGRMGFHDVLRL